VRATVAASRRHQPRREDKAERARERESEREREEWVAGVVTASKAKAEPEKQPKRGLW